MEFYLSFESILYGSLFWPKKNFLLRTGQTEEVFAHLWSQPWSRWYDEKFWSTVLKLLDNL